MRERDKDLIAEMFKAARRAKSPGAAVFYALMVLEREGGYIALPMGPKAVFGTWSPDIRSLWRSARVQKLKEDVGA